MLYLVWIALSSGTLNANASLSTEEVGCNNGNPIDCYRLGFRYVEGIAVDADMTIALKYFEMGAEKGHIECMYQAGLAYYRGEGAVKDDRAAFKWFKKAAERNHARSQYNLSELYKKPDFANKELSQHWLDRAIKNGIKPIVIKKLTDKELGITPQDKLVQVEQFLEDAEISSVIMNMVEEMNQAVDERLGDRDPILSLAIKDAIKEVIEPEKLLEIARLKLSQKVMSADLKEILDWYHGPTGRKLIHQIRNFDADLVQAKFHSYVAETESEPPIPSRRVIIEESASAMQLGRFSTEIKLKALKYVVYGLDKTTHSLKRPSLETVNAQLESIIDQELAKNKRQQILRLHFYLRDQSQLELRDFAKLARGETMRSLMNQWYEVWKETIDEVDERIKPRIISKFEEYKNIEIQRKLASDRKLTD